MAAELPQDMAGSLGAMLPILRELVAEVRLLRASVDNLAKKMDTVTEVSLTQPESDSDSMDSGPTAPTVPSESMELCGGALASHPASQEQPST